jgi:hypothetical protein
MSPAEWRTRRLVENRGIRALRLLFQDIPGRAIFAGSLPGLRRHA